MKIAFELSEPQETRLKERAKALGLTPEEFAQAAVCDLLDSEDAAFEQAISHVLDKNKDLYTRLG